MLDLDFIGWLQLTGVCLASALLSAVILKVGGPLGYSDRFRPRSNKTTRPRAAATIQRPARDIATSNENSAIADLNPYPVWIENEDGDVVWANPAYCKISLEVSERDPCSGPSIFAELPIGRTEAAPLRKLANCPAPAQTEWYDVNKVESDRGKMCFAQDVSKVVAADATRKEFTQTLAKTFAQLSTGLAIFDREKRLFLFNPALVDLCSLPFDFLSSRPDMVSFFDLLRDRQMMPEPKDYVDWRDHFGELSQAASDNRYQETWTLPSGSVYQVSGRSHPGGETAFLFEDISAEVTLTRQFRTELEIGQALFDKIDDAICVFSGSGKMLFANSAYHRFWGAGEVQVQRDTPIDRALTLWSDGTQADGHWSTLRSASDATDRCVQFRKTDGTPAICEVQSLPNGSELFQFRKLDAKSGPLTIQKLTESA